MQSLFRHKPKNHRGRATSREVWVFGLCDTSHSPALGVMCIVPNRSAQTLLPIIQQHVRTGSVIHSDEWAAYRRVQQLQPVSAVNHSLHFVDPATGVHTEHRVLLVLGEEALQENEGRPPVDDASIPGRVHVARASWEECPNCTCQSVQRYRSEVPPVDIHLPNPPVPPPLLYFFF